MTFFDDRKFAKHPNLVCCHIVEIFFCMVAKWALTFLVPQAQGDSSCLLSIGQEKSNFVYLGTTTTETEKGARGHSKGLELYITINPSEPPVECYTYTSTWQARPNVGGEF